MSCFYFGVDGETFPHGPYFTRDDAVAAAFIYLQPNPGAVIYINEEMTVSVTACFNERDNDEHRDKSDQ